MSTITSLSNILSDIEDGFSTEDSSMSSLAASSDHPPLLLGRPAGDNDDLLSFLDGHPLSDMKYRTALKRPAKLPGKIHSDDADFQSAEIERYFRKLWEGTYELRWQERWTDHNRGLFLCVVADEEARTLIPEHKLQDGKYVLVVILVPASADFQPSDHSGATHVAVNTEPLSSLLHISQKDSLSRRVMHRFFRNKASQLSQFYLEQVYLLLEQYYITQNWFTEAVDCGMIIVDTLLFGTAAPYANQVFFANKLAEALEGKERYADAAALNEDIATHWDGLTNEFATLPQCGINPTRIWSNAGLAHKRSGNYTEAERCFVRALWVDLNQRERLGEACSPLSEWDVNDKDTKTVFHNLCLIYASWHIVRYLIQARYVSAEDVPETDSLDKRCFPILNGLGKKAGIEYDSHVATCNAQASIQQVKNKFVATDKAAKKAIQKALSSTSPSVEDFRAKLFNYHNTNRKEFELKLIEPQIYMKTLGLDRKGQKSIKHRTRDQVRKITLRDACKINERCSNCKRQFPREEIMWCPCKNVGYCGKECQIAHWNADHKQSCPLQASKKKA